MEYWFFITLNEGQRGLVIIAAVMLSVYILLLIVNDIEERLFGRKKQKVRDDLNRMYEHGCTVGYRERKTEEEAKRKRK